MKEFWREILVTLAIALAIYLLLQTVIQSSIVNNVSMEPGLIEGQRLIVGKAAYWFADPDRGDIAVLYPPIQPDEQWVKRVIGLPGDTVQVKEGIVYINNYPLDEPYLKEESAYNYGPIKVTEDCYFVLGDNRNHSTDSHFGWTVERDQIVGKAWLCIWPFSRFGLPCNYDISSQMK